MKILIIQPKIGMGDMVIYLPYIHSISKKYKTAISLLVKENSRAAEILKNDDQIQEIIKSKRAIYDLKADQRSNKIGFNGNELVKYPIDKLPKYLKDNLNNLSYIRKQYTIQNFNKVFNV